MKTLQLILRILVSPFVFLFSCGLMTVFPGPLALIIGLGALTMQILGMDEMNSTKQDWKETFIMSTIWFWYPFVNTKMFIVDAKFLS